MVKHKRLALFLLLFGMMTLTLSCFGGKKTTSNKEQEIVTKGGKDYVKVPNPLYAVWQGQPEYIYVPKSQYRPLLGERIVGEDVRIKQQFLERKIARLERELKSGGVPGGAGGIAIPANRIMKKRVVILPMQDNTDSLSKEEKIYFRQALTNSLNKTKHAIIEDPMLLKSYQEQDWWAKGSVKEDLLARAGSALGVQAFVKIDVDRLEVIHQLNANKESYKATVTLSLKLYDGLAGTDIYTTKIDVFPDEIQPYPTPAEAENAVLKQAASEITQSVLPQLSKLEWFTHIVRVDKAKKMIIIQGGRDDGLYIGDLLNVYDKPGKEIFNQLTGEFMGREPGKFKGRLQIVEFFGVNAAITKPLLGDSFKVGDFVKLAR